MEDELQFKSLKNLFLNLKPVEFEETYFFWILQEEKVLIGLENKVTKKVLTEDDWIKAFADVRTICLLIRNYVAGLDLIGKIDKNNEKEIICQVFIEIYKQLKKFIKIDDLDAEKDFFSKNLNRNDDDLKSNVSFVELDFKSDEYLSKLSSNLDVLKFGVCRDFSFYILSIMQMLGFDLKKVTLVCVPDHIFVRYINNSINLNFETMFEDWKKNSPFLTDKDYLSIIKFDNNSKNCYLENLDVSGLKSRFYLSLGFLSDICFKEYEKARECYAKALKLNSKDCQTYNNFGSLLGNDYFREYKKARECFEKALELDFKHSITYYNLGILLSNDYFKEYEKARRCYEKALRLNPFDILTKISYINLLENHFVDFYYLFGKKFKRSERSKKRMKEKIKNF